LYGSPEGSPTIFIFLMFVLIFVFIFVFFLIFVSVFGFFFPLIFVVFFFVFVLLIFVFVFVLNFCFRFCFLNFCQEKTETDLHRLPLWLLWLRRIIKSLQIIVLLLQACLRFTSFVRYDRRLLKNCFQQRLIFYGTPVFHHDFVKFLYCRVVCSDKRQ